MTLNSSGELRTDIQALRGLAVLLVVVYHANLGWLNAGYLGVDIFFVISGFLITTMVAARIERGDFTLRNFYFRRAKRLLPAAYVAFAATALVSPWLLNQQELRDLAWQIIGAVTFTANILLWRQTGYFDGASELKPLLHTWSLSIEEQYYLLLPAALMLLPRRAWLKATAVALAISLVTCLMAVYRWPSATFYLLPTRAWELLAGSLGALAMLHANWRLRVRESPLVRWMFWPCVAALLVVPIAAGGLKHPGLAAAVVCVATLVVILGHHPALSTSAASRGLARVGDISYSLYLVHWPVLALMRNSYTGTGGDVPVEWRLLAVILSFGLSVSLYRWVEEPVRRSNISLSRSLVVKAAAASLAVAAIVPVAVRSGRDEIDFARLLRVNHGLSAACEFKDRFEPRPECQSGDNPKLLVWGDSYAMHLVPGLAAALGAPTIIQATKSGCGPVLGIGPERPVHPGTGLVYDSAWSRSCLSFNDSVISFIEASKDIDVVVLSSPLEQYVGAEWVHNLPSNGGLERVAPSVKSSAAALVATAERLRANGKRVVVFAPPPSTGQNAANCLERKVSGRFSWGGLETCSISRQEYRRVRHDVLALLDAVERAGVPVVRLDEFLCDDYQCRALIDGTMIYRDQGHLSHEGSKLVAQKMHWPQLIAEVAR